MSHSRWKIKKGPVSFYRSLSLPRELPEGNQTVISIRRLAEPRIHRELTALYIIERKPLDKRQESLGLRSIELRKK